MSWLDQVLAGIAALLAVLLAWNALSDMWAVVRGRSKPGAMPNTAPRQAGFRQFLPDFRREERGRLEFEIGALRGDLAKAQALIQSMTNSEIYLRQEVLALKAKLANAEGAIENAGQRSTGQVEELRAALAQRDASAKELRAMLATKDEQIAELLLRLGALTRGDKVMYLDQASAAAQASGRDHKFAVAKRRFAQLFHPNTMRHEGAERRVREALFKEFWGELEKIEAM